MKHKWKCEECVKHGTDACYNGGRYDHNDCKYMLIDVDYAYNKGKADRDKEIAEHNVFFSNKPIEDIVLDARAKVLDEFLKEAFKEIEQRIADGKKEKNVYLNKWDLKCIAKRVKEQRND